VCPSVGLPVKTRPDPYLFLDRLSLRGGRYRRGDGFCRPQLIAQFLSRDQVAGGLRQNGQHLQRLTPEAKLYAAFAQFASAPIQLQIVEAENRGGERSRSGHRHIRGTSASLSHSRGEYLFARRRPCASEAYGWRKLWGAMEPPSIAWRPVGVARLRN
jgi:hypothetical protein